MRQLQQLRWLRLCLVAVVLLMSSTLRAQTNTIFEEKFESEKNFPPEGWVWGGEGPSWFWTSQGAGEENGSAVINLMDHQTDFIRTPTIDVSMYKEGEVTLEFDYWMQSNESHRETGLNDWLYVTVGEGKKQVLILERGTGKHFTYEAKGTYDGVTSEKDHWGHISMTLPAEVLSSELQLNFSGGFDEEPLSNIAIDNIAITVPKPIKSYTYSPKNIAFGNIEVGFFSDVTYVTLKNPNSDDMRVSDFRFAGSFPQYFEIVEGADFIPGGSEEKPGQALIGIRYNPRTFGDHSANLYFWADADVDPEGVVALTGRGALPEISTNGAKNLFSRTRTQLGAYRDTSFVVTHSSTLGKLRISSGSYIDGEYASQYEIVRLPSAAIEPGVSDTITVRYMPNIEGARWANLVLVSNAGNGTQRIELRGVGILQRLTVTPESHTFDSIAMGEQSCKTFTFSNPGSDTLRIRDLYFSSADPDFSFQSMDGRSFSIAPLQSRDISVCFAPRKMGSRQANLRVLTDIPDTFEATSRDTSEFNIAITGTGVPFGDLTFEDNLVDSGAVGEEFCTSHTIMNVGQYSITVTSASIVGPDAAEFAFRNATFPITLEPGAETTLTICTTPGARGLRQASIVAYTTSNSQKDTVTLPVDAYGQIICAEPSAASLFEGEPVLIGQTKTMSVVVSNCGDIASVYTAAVIGEGYQIVGDMVTAMIPAGGTHEFSVLFTPSIVGAQTATLAINARDVAPMSIALNGTGGGVTASHNNFSVPETAVGATQEFSVTVTNNGNVDWTTGTPSIDGAAYSTTSTGLTLAPGASDVMTFTFAPASAGMHTGTVTFPSAAPAATPSYSIALSGVGAVASVGRPTVMNGFELEQNYPNPVQPSTTVRFITPYSAVVTIALVDMTGETIKTITSASYPTGTHAVQLDASELSAGTYFYVLMSEGVKIARQMTVIK